ncbi:MAG TPA: flagellar hook assembly protein FlgD [Chromatiales bacterium]|nr:flagellar hook assembly protein FlgD [Chromatiales bacterium]
MQVNDDSLQARLDALGLTRKPDPEAKKRDELGQADFLKLMTAQLENQDPLKPLENKEFLGQLAQFSVVQGLAELQGSFSSLATSLQSNQALQASALVGKSVLVESPFGVLGASEGLSGAVELPEQVADLRLRISDVSGQVVRELPLDGQGPGMVDFKWDGFSDAGEPLPPGYYHVVAEGTLDGETQSFTTYAVGRVDSVVLGGEQGGMMLNLEGLGQYALDEVAEIRAPA